MAAAELALAAGMALAAAVSVTAVVVVKLVPKRSHKLVRVQNRKKYYFIGCNSKELICLGQLRTLFC